MTGSEYLETEIKGAITIHCAAMITPELKEEVQFKVDEVIRNYKARHVTSNRDLSATAEFDPSSGTIIIKFEYHGEIY